MFRSKNGSTFLPERAHSKRGGARPLHETPALGLPSGFICAKRFSKIDRKSYSHETPFAVIFGHAESYFETKVFDRYTRSGLCRIRLSSWSCVRFCRCAYARRGV